MAGTCPKCDADRNPGPECGKCGVIYAKAEQQAYHERRGPTVSTAKNTETRLKPCPACKNEVSKNAPSCPHCGEILIEDFRSKTNDIGNIIGIFGSVLLAIGVFSPMVSIPIIGTINFFKNGQGDGIIFLLLAFVALVLCLLKKYRPLLWIGIVAAVIIAFDLYEAVTKMSEIKSKAMHEMAGNPFKGIGEAMSQSIQLQWGWAVIMSGAAAIIVGSIIGLKETKNENTRRYS